MKILIGTSSFAEYDSAPLVALETAGVNIIRNPFGRRLTDEELKKLLDDEVIGIVAGLESLKGSILSDSKLQVISRCGAGLSNVDLNVAKRLGIQVFSTPNPPTNAVAELTLGAILSLLRHIPLINQDMHQKIWRRRMGGELFGKTILIVGFGRIGRRLSELLEPFGIQILVFDPYLDKSNYPLVSLGEGLVKADIITLHASGEECLLGEKEFSIMKKGAILLNPSRGALIEESALIHALKMEIVSGAWIDVFCQEPYEGPLSQFSQVILSPHIGSFTQECRKNMEMEAVNNLLKGFINEF